MKSKEEKKEESLPAFIPLSSEFNQGTCLLYTIIKNNLLYAK